ncbi:hypothetical protein [Streptomyces marincola]|uniref:Uncharacterized protein n=1 Tax=Streptomyces marincola TaxID=2878388 RepID=A0A1W7CY19_9ACTN|nr:hypothetical protein [Streptomyces marincola]ARQ69698.1 hypothetical protein CAG99_13220 [Streptomyces marincola]
MHDDNVLLESRTLRDRYTEQVDALDKVKALELLPDGLHVTTEAVAAYFVVHREVVKKLVQRHRDELSENGLSVLRGSDLRSFQRDNMSLWGGSYPQAPTHLTLYTRRTVLNIAMLLRDSAVARRVRKYLLDAEAAGRLPSDDVSRAIREMGRSLQELGPVIHRMSVRLEHVERRVDNTDRVVCAMSERLATLQSRDVS